MSGGVKIILACDLMLLDVLFYLLHRAGRC